jgi:hypothetical protein
VLGAESNAGATRMTPISFDKNDRVDPVPYTVREFACLIGVRPRDVVEMTSRGKLKCITDGIHARIPVSEARRLVEEVLTIEEEIREDIARFRRGIEENDRVDPEPYTVKEFARRIRARPRDVIEMISRGKLNCVTFGTSLRIPVNEMRRRVYEQLTNEEGVHEGIALAIRDGIVEEVGLDKHGNMVFRRKRSASSYLTASPWCGTECACCYAWRVPLARPYRGRALSHGARSLHRRQTMAAHRWRGPAHNRSSPSSRTPLTRFRMTGGASQF